MFKPNGITVLSLTAEQLSICSDKYTLPGVLKSYGLNAPEAFTVDEFAPDGGQYFVKLRNSSGSRLTHIFETKEQLVAIAEQTTKEIVVQRYIPSPETEYTVGVFATDKEIRTIAFRRKLEGVYTQFIELADDDSQF